MPKFDLITKPVQMPNAVQIQESSAPIQIQQQSRNQLSGAVDALGGAYQGMLEEQDNADMVATRSAVLRLKADEDAELAQTANPADIKTIQEKYKTQYDNIIGGKEPLNNKPYFRNQSGKDKFNKGFMANFNSQRYAQGKQKEVELQRRDTHAKYMNGIKSIIDQPNWNTPSAHAETDEYVNKLIEGGYYTAEEGAEFRKITHTNLDIERSNKMFADIEMIPYEGEGEGLKKIIDGYKSQVSNLNHLEQDEKNAYLKKADALFKNKKAINTAQQREVKMAQEKVQNEYGFKKMVDLVEGNATHSQLLEDPNIPMSYKKQALTSYAKKIEDDNELRSNQKAMDLASTTRAKVLSYNVSFDDNRKKRLELIDEINKNIIDTNERTQLVNFLTDGYGMSPQEKVNYDVHQKKLSDLLALDVGYDKSGKLIDPRGIEPDEMDGGKLLVDSLDQYERSKAYGVILNNYMNLVKLGKPKEANDYINTEMQKIEKTNNDRIFYDNLMSRELVNTQYKGSK